MPDPDHIDVNVLNASGVNGRALDVFVDLGQRGFQMFSTTEGLSPDAYPEAVVIRYQPRTAGAAWLLSLYFHGRVRSQLGGTTDSDRVDVILGSAYAGVLTPAEVQQAVAVAGVPVRRRTPAPAPIPMDRFSHKEEVETAGRSKPRSAEPPIWR